MSKALRAVIFTGLFLVPFVPLIISDQFFFPFFAPKAFVFRIIIEVVFAAWVILALKDKEARPKRSLILYSLSAFLVVIGLVNLFGMEPVKSFWSNFERMEGYVGLLHLGAFFLVISSMFSEKQWEKWFHITLATSFSIALYSFIELASVPGARVMGTLGNATYLAVYMLIHVFLAIWMMWRRRENAALCLMYGSVILVEVLALYYTATRGAVLALGGGLILILLLNVRSREEVKMRKFSTLAAIVTFLVIGGFYLVKDSQTVASNPTLSRLSSISLEEFKQDGRYFVWPMAIKGFKEKPMLGWGQENFNYVFEKHYDPAMARLEPWFDRAHNIFLDWLVAGGILGLFAYLSLYATLLYLIWKDARFAYTEKSILTGLIAAYFFHNFFVFDHLISYILFFSILAYVHSRSSGRIFEKNISLSEKFLATVSSIAVILLLALLWVVNVKPMAASANLINALSHAGTVASVDYLERAYNDSRLGRTEIIDQLIPHSRIIFASNLEPETKDYFFHFANAAVRRQAEDFRQDARYQLIAGMLLSIAGRHEESIVYFDRAVGLMPTKQNIYIERGTAYLNMGENAKAMADLKRAYELAEGYTESEIVYLLGAIYTGDKALELSLLEKIPEKDVMLDGRIITAYENTGRTADAINVFERRIILDPLNAETYKKHIERLKNNF